MIDQLICINLPTSSRVDTIIRNSCFVLETCQRTLVLEFCPKKLSFLGSSYHQAESYYGKGAYTFLLETICGLKSELKGESEIVFQFKQAYIEYLKLSERNSDVIKLLEKLFKDGKQIRSKYLYGLSQKTYASITRKFILSRKNVENILVLGTGTLAKDIINQFKGKVNVMISGRNQNKVEELCLEHDIQSIPWLDFDAYATFPHIANTIGSKEILFDDSLFDLWVENTSDNRLLVDLGAPSPIETTHDIEDGLIRLKEIFEKGEEKDQEKQEKIDLALTAIDEVVEHRRKMFHKTLVAQRSLEDENL